MCVPCVIKQCERIVRALLTTGTPPITQLVSQIRNHALNMAAQLSLDDPPSKYTSQVLEKVYELLQADDPYQKIKLEQNETGKKIYHHFAKEIARAADPIHFAIRFAASGNIIDVGPSEIYSAHSAATPYFEEINKMVNQPLKIDNYKIFQEKFRSAENILYILDNAGEIYLDKLLIERLKGPAITLVVKAQPILNDALIVDALEAGLNNFGKIITVNPKNKPRYLGVDFSCLTDEFMQAFESADMVIAKGHANFESLVDCERDCFFILMAKCPVVARKLGVEIKDRVLYYSANKGD
ncbi:MAG: DUF89 family protein [Candidatus Latescibacteria bacterium]|nr:DUF89 family protein [Candidatus Latescibacterota bacterium]